MAARKPRVVRISEIVMYFGDLTKGSYWFGNQWCPAVFEREHGGFTIRVLASQRQSGNSADTNYAYFELDADGVLTSVPRGFAATFKPGQIADIKTWAERFATPDPTARRIA